MDSGQISKSHCEDNLKLSSSQNSFDEGNGSHHLISKRTGRLYSSEKIEVTGKGKILIKLRTRDGKNSPSKSKSLPTPTKMAFPLIRRASQLVAPEKLVMRRQYLVSNDEKMEQRRNTPRNKSATRRTAVRKENTFPAIFKPPIKVENPYLVPNHWMFYDLYQNIPKVYPAGQEETEEINISHNYLSRRLKNMLALPKALKWTSYEWFYSDIDRAILQENDFQTCLNENFPQLKTRKLSRVQWCKIRRLLGKPRRCSQKFFNEEREGMTYMRQKIRMIQQRKIPYFDDEKLPSKIPHLLFVGTKVYARLLKPVDGIFEGTVEGIDISNGTYRISFDRKGKGTHSVVDYEVCSKEKPEMMFASMYIRRHFSSQNQKTGTGEDKVTENSILKYMLPEGIIGGFPIQFLRLIVLLSKLLKTKRGKIVQLKELNAEAEIMISYSKPFNADYIMKYARCILDLGVINDKLSVYLSEIQQSCLEIAPDKVVSQMVIPELVQDHCKQEAVDIVDSLNVSQTRAALVNTSKGLSLISNLVSLLLQVKSLSKGNRNAHELKGIKDTLKDIKTSLSWANVPLFQNKIEIPMNRIHGGLAK